MKTIGSDSYVHITNIKELPKELSDKVKRARDIFGNKRVQVIKVSKSLDRVSFLLYPNFWKQVWPELKESWTVDIEAKKITHRNYNPDNPPILHRKELFIKSNAKGIKEMIALTKRCEEAGMFAEPKKIGKKKFWYALLEEKMEYETS